MNLYDIKWETLKILGASKIMTFAALMPFFGFLIITNNYVINFLESMAPKHLGFQFVSDDGDIGLKIYALYYGSVLLGLGKLIFNYCCPNEIVEYGSREHYMETRDRLKTEYEYKKFLDEVEKQNPEDKNEVERLRQSDQRNQALDSTGEGFRTLLSLRWAYLNQAGGSRYVIAFFFGSGLLFLSFPSIVTFCNITLAFFTD